MSFIAELLTGFLTPILANRGKRVKVAIGLIPIGLAAVMFSYYVWEQPQRVEDYHVMEISYSRCYYAEKSESPKIILESGDNNYKIYYYIWQISNDEPETIVRELSTHSKATIWLSEEGSTHINGIATPTFTIAPSVGVEWERANHRSLLYLVIGFFVLGVVAMVIFVTFA